MLILFELRQGLQGLAFGTFASWLTITAVTVRFTGFRYWIHSARRSTLVYGVTDGLADSPFVFSILPASYSHLPVDSVHTQQ